MIRFLFQSYFKESWIIIYAPLDLAVAMTLYNYLLQSKWRDFAGEGIGIFILGVVLGHAAFVDHHATRVYVMNVVSKSPYVLLRSDKWPQILFVAGNAVTRSVAEHPFDQGVPVEVAVVTDYGCIHTAEVKSVARVDVGSDPSSTWTWRINNYATTSEYDGPGMEDLRLPWCKHIQQVRDIENIGSFVRPWDELLQNAEGKKQFRPLL